MKIDSGTNVTSTDRWLDEIRRGRSFVGAASQSALAAQYSLIQLLNPAASGVIVLVYHCVLSTPTAQSISARQYNAALTTNSAAVVNLLSGGSAPTAQMRRENNAALPGTDFFSLDVSASDARSPFPLWMHELGQGEGILIGGVTVNTALNANFFWVEV